MVSERLESAALFIEPGFEFHSDRSLDETKRYGQGFSKPRMFMLGSNMDDLAHHRKKRLQALIDGKPFHGNQSAFAFKAGLSKGRISQLLDPKESFGERSAMNLAAKLGLQDDRYFERSTDAPAEAEPTRPEPDQISAALGILTEALQSADRATRTAVAPLLSLLALEPDQAENVCAMLVKLLPSAELAHASQHDQRTGRQFTTDLPSLENKESLGAKRIQLQNRGRT
jgi:hypothetical protein